jgi:aldehyde dehydrogenase (NAD+)
MGVVAAITPWNFPMTLSAFKMPAALVAGNTVVLKPASQSPLSVLRAAELASQAGLPDGVLQVVTGSGPITGAALASDDDVATLTFTGSTAVGKQLLHYSADSNAKPIWLELGGKSPNIILDDADFSTAIPMAVAACYLNNGQACIAASRLIVPQDRLDEVKRLTKAAVEQIKMGDPRNKDVTLGPLASVKQYKRVQEYIKSGIEEGAELVIGGEGHPQGLESGNFVKPTVFANVTRDMRIAREEIFGPVLSILTYKTEAEAIEIANDTEFGLIAYVSSADPERANRVARKLAAGRVLINTIGHDPFAPFGGFKQSGIGREGGIFGLEEYLEPKAIIS